MDPIKKEKLPLEGAFRAAELHSLVSAERKTANKSLLRFANRDGGEIVVAANEKTHSILSFGHPLSALKSVMEIVPTLAKGLDWVAVRLSIATTLGNFIVAVSMNEIGHQLG